MRNDDTATALKSIDAADTLLRQRQKKIKLADKSEAGWLAVKEYETDDLASNSDDEKRIRKAKMSAIRKRRQNAIKKDKDDLRRHILLIVVVLTINCFFEVIYAPSLFYQGQASVCTSPAISVCV